MGKIKILPENIANKIAAGEVVERPASVVKELVENSLDAGSGKITVEVKNGGKELIRVIDDGAGMTYDDAVLSVERHATSKIQSLRDLESITTLGFRGEALPSIAAVSRFELVTRTRESIEGTRVRVEGGVRRDVERVGSPIGTRVTVSNLFYNIPARRKFLKSNVTELDHIIKYITSAGLAHPQVSFKLISDDKTIIEARRCDTVIERIHALYGRDFAENVVELSLGFETVKLHAFIGKPEFTKSSRDYQLFFLNLRPIRSNLLSSAVGSAFKSILPKGRYPVVILFLEVDPKLVDVNVHPAKAEVRFRDERSIYSEVMRCLSMAMQSQEYIPLMDKPVLEAKKTKVETTAYPRKVEVESSVFKYLDRQKQEKPTFTFSRPKLLPGESDQWQVRQKELSATPSIDLENIQLKARLFNTYIVVEAENDVLFIDQHIADERVIYEKLKSQMEQSAVSSQGLLLPLTVELSPAQMSALDIAMELLTDMGFELERFGGRTVIIRAVPALMQRGDIKQIVTDLIDQVASSYNGQDKLKLQEELLIMSACRSAIQAGDALTDAEALRLLKELFNTSQPFMCPHGRPIIVRMNRAELDERFQRK